MKKLIRTSTLLSAGLFLLIYMISCGSSTVITGTWDRGPGVEDYSDILVAALIPSTSQKSILERHIAQNLREMGVNASQSLEMLPPKFIENEDEKQKILNSIQTNGADAILTVSIIDEDTKSRYVQGSGTYAPYPYYGYYGTFWGYYDYWYPRFYRDGYYTQEKVFYIETNLYDAETENLVWSAQSKTYDPDNLKEFSEDFAVEIVEQLNEDDIL